MRNSRKLFKAAAALGIAMLVAAGCSSKKDSAASPALPATMTTPAAPGSCTIDASKMCEASGGGPGKASAPPAPATMPPSYYASPMQPDAIEFQIPAGQTVKLMCYYDPQHKAVVRADATPDAPLTAHSVEYLKSQKFCQ